MKGGNMNLSPPLTFPSSPCYRKSLLTVTSPQHNPSSPNSAMSRTVTGSGDGQFAHLNRVHPIDTTRGKIMSFSVALTSFLCALYIFVKSETGVSNVGCASIAHVAFYCTAAALFVAVMVFILFTSYCNTVCEMYRRHFLLKSIGDFLFKSAECFLLKLKNSGVDSGAVFALFCRGDSMAPAAAPRAPITPFSSEIEDLIICVLLTVTALSLINLLSPGYHYYIFEVTTTVTMHSSLELMYSHPYISAATTSFVFLIISLKNFLWRNVANSRTRLNQNHPPEA